MGLDNVCPVWKGLSPSCDAVVKLSAGSVINKGSFQTTGCFFYMGNFTSRALRNMLRVFMGRWKLAVYVRSKANQSNPATGNK